MLLSLILILAALFLLLLLVPVDLEGRGAFGKRPEIRIIWLFGLIKMELLEERSRGRDRPDEKITEQNTAAEEGQEEISRAEKKAETDGSGWGVQDILSIFQTKGLMKDLKRLLNGLVYAIRIRYLRGCIRIGLQDPADTGQAAGSLWSLAGWLQSLYPVEIEIEPSFCQEVLEGEGQGALRIWPILVALSLLRFSFSRPVLSASLRLIQLVSRKRKKSIHY
jgi:hypothetical protein